MVPDLRDNVRKLCRFFQIPNDQRHFFAFPRHPSRSRGRQDQAGGQGGHQVELQAVAAGAEDRGSNPYSAQHFGRSGKISSFRLS